MSLSHPIPTRLAGGHSRPDDSSDDEDDFIPAPRRAHPGVCHLCLAPPPPLAQPPSPPLLRCSQCQLVVYCSKLCQKTDWKTHKQLCRANKVVGGLGALSGARSHVAAGGSWLVFRDRVVAASAAALRRPLTVAERDVLTFARVCQVCRSAEPGSLASCPVCHSVLYCSDAHRAADEESHRALCSAYLLSLRCDTDAARHGVRDLKLPAQIDDHYKRLPEMLIDLVRPQLTPEECSDPVTVACVTERLSYPLSLLYALERVSVGGKPVEELTDLYVHVVGATGFNDIVGIIRWEYLMHRLPKLRFLHYVFVGPHLFGEEIEEDRVPPDYNYHCMVDGCEEMCDTCREDGRKVHYELYLNLYHKFAKTSFYKKPDIVIAHNCEFHQYDSEGKNTWTETFPCILRDNIPVVFTSFSEREAKLDLKELAKRAEVEVVIPPHKNPFASVRPYRYPQQSEHDPHMCAWNQYITCVKSTNGQSL